MPSNVTGPLWLRLLKRSIGLMIVLGLVALGVFLGFGYQRLFSRAPGVAVIPTATILRQVQALSELVTIKYVYEKVVILEDVKWFGENRVLLLAHGVIKGGVDLKTLNSAGIQVQGKNISLRLPAAVITDIYLDEGKTRVIERNTGVLRGFDKDMEQTARRQAIEDLRRAAKQGGILKDAEERARLQMRSLLSGLGFEKIEIEFE